MSDEKNDAARVEADGASDQVEDEIESNSTAGFLVYRSMPGKAQKTWWREDGVTTWDEFVEWLRAENSGGKTGRPYVAASFGKRRTRRRNVDLVDRYAITLDADNAGPDYLDRLAEVAPYRAISHTTASHGTKGERWRTILPVSRPMTPVESKSIAAYLVEVIGRERFDVQASTAPVAVAYAPAWAGCEFKESDGDILDVDELLLFVPEASWGADDREHPTADEYVADLPTLGDDACAYGSAALARARADLAETEDGHRHFAIYAAAARFVEMSKAGCWGAEAADELANAADECAEDGSGAPKFWEAVSSALAHGVEAKSACEDHDEPAEVFDALDPEEAGTPDPWAGLLTGHVTRVLANRDRAAVVGRIRDSSAAGIADLLLDSVWTKKGATGEERCLILRTWTGVAYEHHDTHWEPIPASHLEASIQALLAGATKRKKVGDKFKWVPLRPTTTLLKEVAKQLELKTIIHSKIGPGHWIDCTSGRCPVGEEGRRYLSFKNGILDLDTEELFKHESAFFNTYSMHFDYDPAATAPTWERSLEEWFPEDEESRECLEEVLGYLLLGGMEHDKIFPLLGEPRSGKGTVMRVLHSMIGSGFTTQSFDELADRFGKEDLLGKSVCHISEAVSTRDARRVVSMLKSISGQDDGQTVKRKGSKSEHEVTFSVRFVLTGNEEIVLPDESGVIIDRLVAIYFGQSFLGKENSGLTKQLVAESSGIFNRLRVAYERLSERRHFVQPASAEELVSALRRKAAPNKAWFADTFIVTKDPADFVTMKDAESMYRAGQDERYQRRMTAREAQMAVSKLFPVGVSTGRRYVDGKQVRVIFGVRERGDDEE